MILNDYQVSQLIYQSEKTLVYRAVRKRDQQPFVLKVLQQRDLTSQAIGRFQREFQIVSSLKDEGVIDVEGLYEDQGRLFMVFENGGDHLVGSDLAASQSISELLDLALQLTRALGRVHDEHIIHKDINPSNIVIQPRTGRVKLIDFGIATRLSKELSSFKPVDLLQGTPAYMSPEQSGRINMDVDYRTDYYALGATLYDLFVGRPPFEAEDVLALIHCHIAEELVAPHRVRVGLPLPISNVISKLLAKDPDHRYQSLRGLEADLTACRRMALSGDWNPDFVAGNEDFSERFELSQKLYGREQEESELLSSFNNLEAGGAEILLISGYSGIGKTSLVQEIYKPITAQRGNFIKGKFDMLEREIPYGSILEAIKGLIRQIIAGDRQSEARLSQRILAEMGAEIALLVAMLPELELLVGQQESLTEVGPTETRHRFQRAIYRLLCALSDREHPLVIFLDDLQWSDAASLELLIYIMGQGGVPHCFWLGAFRDNEVDAAHPLSKCLKEIEGKGIAIKHLQLSPLRQEHIAAWVADSFTPHDGDAPQLAALILKKTGGNPYFVKQFLGALHRDGLFRFEGEKRSWHWRLDVIKSRDVTENLLTIIGSNLETLPEASREVVKLAGCFGNRFELGPLAQAMNMEQATCADLLWPAIESGLIFPLGENYSPIGDGEVIAFKFAHDRVKEAAYAMINPANLPGIHWRLGGLLQSQYEKGDTREMLFSILLHLNLGRQEAHTWKERVELAALNLSGGRQAKASAAYQSARHYFEAGAKALNIHQGMKEILPEQDYQLVIDLCTEAAETAYLCGEMDETLTWTEIVLKLAREFSEKMKSYEVRIQGFTALNRFADAQEIGLSVLKSLGFDFEGWSDDQLADKLDRIFNLLNNDKILAGDPMRDANSLAAMRIMSYLWVPIFIMKPTLTPRVTAQQVYLSMTEGYCRESIQAFINFAMLCSCQLNRPQQADQLDKLSRDLIEKLDEPQLKPYVVNISTCYVRHWRVPLRAMFAEVGEATRISSFYGDIEFATTCTHTLYFMRFLAGCELEPLAREMKDSKLQLDRAGVNFYLDWFEIVRQTIANLLGQEKVSERLAGGMCDETEMAPRLVQASDTWGQNSLDLHTLMLAYRFGDYQTANERGRRLRHTNSQEGNLYTMMIVFYRSLAELALMNEMQKDHLDVVLKDLAILRKATDEGRANYAHKYWLVEAEVQRVFGDHDNARTAFDIAIDLALEHEYFNEASLACELAGKYYLQQDYHRLAGYYIRDAYALLNRWQAWGLAQRLKNNHPQFLAGSDGRYMASPTTNTTDERDAESLDLATLFKASQTISKEIQLKQLINHVLKVLMENAGASRACLMIQERDTWLVVANRTTDSNESSYPRIAIDEYKSLPLSVIRTVIKTQTHVITQQADPFVDDPYFRQNSRLSVMCCPIHHQGSLSAIVYLENHLIADAFTADRLRIVEMLSSQAAISMANARLYQELEEKVAERTKALQDALVQLEESHLSLKQTQAQLVSSEKLATLGPLTAGIAHEINNPNCIVATHNQNLKRELSSFFDELSKMAVDADSSVLDYFEARLEKFTTITSRIEEGTERIQSIVDDLRGFSHHEEAEDSQICINETLRSTLHLVRSGFEDISEVIFSPEQEVWLTCKPARLGQVFLNILLNAFQAVVTKQAQDSNFKGIITVHLTQEPDQVVIRIEDNGQGIPRDLRQKIFEPFFTTRDIGFGSGLGLAICQGIVGEHRGRIEVDSIEGEGSSFWIYLPTNGA